MAKPNYQFEKRQRELAKKKKKEEKKLRKAEKSEQTDQGPGPVPEDDAKPDPAG